MPTNPNTMNIVADIHLMVFSGICLPKKTPTTIPAPSATSMPSTAPIRTAKALWYSAAKLIVVSWVLSPNSAMKKAAATIPTTPKRDGFGFSSLAFSGFKVQSPKPMKDSDAAKEITSIGKTVVMSCPITTMIAKFAIVAKKIAKRTLYGLYLVAKDMAINWVLSPISATTMSAKEAVKAATLNANNVFHHLPVLDGFIFLSLFISFHPKSTLQWRLSDVLAIERLHP